MATESSPLSTDPEDVLSAEDAQNEHDRTVAAASRAWTASDESAFWGGEAPEDPRLETEWPFDPDGPGADDVTITITIGDNVDVVTCSIEDLGTTPALAELYEPRVAASFELRGARPDYEIARHLTTPGEPVEPNENGLYDLGLPLGDPGSAILPQLTINGVQWLWVSEVSD